MSQSNLETLIHAAELTQDEIGEVLGIEGSAVNHKLAGRRRWYREEINKFLALLSARLRRRVKYEEAFGDARPQRREASVQAGRR